MIEFGRWGKLCTMGFSGARLQTTCPLRRVAADTLNALAGAEVGAISSSRDGEGGSNVFVLGDVGWLVFTGRGGGWCALGTDGSALLTTCPVVRGGAKVSTAGTASTSASVSLQGRESQILFRQVGGSTCALSFLASWKESTLEVAPLRVLEVSCDYRFG